MAVGASVSRQEGRASDACTSGSEWSLGRTTTVQPASERPRKELSAKKERWKQVQKGPLTKSKTNYYGGPYSIGPILILVVKMVKYVLVGFLCIP